MIERATACLKAGARDSLRCAPKLSRSTRALHSSFWHHAATDLDAAPWLVASADLGSDPLIRYSHHSDAAPSSTDASLQTKPSHDGVLLDFLYPPQALAWLQRVNGLIWEKRERRCMKRATEGLGQVGRRYASRCYQTVAGAGLGERLAQIGDDEHFEDHAGRRMDVAHSHGIRDLARQPDALDEIFPNDVLSDTASSSLRPAAPERSSSRAFAQKEDDIAMTDGHDVKRTPTDSHRLLLRLLTRPGNFRDASQIAWTLYNELEEKSREDVRLKIELLNWMSKLRTKIADAHCISLYWSIPLKDRSSAVYLAALSSFLRRHNYDFATGLQKEALENIANGGAISRVFFEHAIRRQLWELAQEVMHHHIEILGKFDSADALALFWIDVPKIPLLVHRASRLIRWMSRQRHEGAQVDEYRTMSIGLANEALVDYLEHDYPHIPNEATSKDVPLLLRHLAMNEHANSIFLEKFLLRLLEHPGTEFRKDHVRRLVSTAYLLYQKSTGVRPGEHLLMRLLEKATAYASTAQHVPPSRMRITIDEIVLDWKQWHGQLSTTAVKHLVNYFAYMGVPGKVQEYMDYLFDHYPDPETHQDALHSMIYVHARRADLPAAVGAFDHVTQIAAKSGHRPDLRCWNNLLYAHDRVDDLAGALSTFERLAKRTDLQPVEISAQPILQMLARRGDVEGVERFMSICENIVGTERPLAFVSALMTALLRNEELDQANSELEKSIAQVRDGKERGSLTPLFNILMTTHALRRDYTATLGVWRWMKREGIRLNAMTFASLLHVSTLTRRTHVAHRILKSSMPEHGIDATAFHYAIVMVGYIRQQQYIQAVKLHEDMITANIRESFSSRRALLAAKMVIEHKETPPPQPLEAIQAAIKEAIETHTVEGAFPKEPGLGSDRGDLHHTLALYLQPLISLYGRRRCLDAIQDLFDQYKRRVSSDGEAPKPLPLGLLTAFMESHVRAHKYAEVEACWHIAKEQAEMEAVAEPVPEMRPGGDEAVEEGAVDALAPVDPVPETAPTPERKRKAVTKLRLAPARRHILSVALRHYLSALGAQSRFRDAIAAVSTVLRQGFALDMYTWNHFIQLLCRSSPPLVLTAFTFTERYLIAQFPGWKRSRREQRRDDRRFFQGLQYIRARHVGRSQVLPHYRTLLGLGAALLQLRRKEATTGSTPTAGVSPEMARLVGDVRAIRARAPRTLFVVQSMPRVDERQEAQLLRSSVR